MKRSPSKSKECTFNAEDSYVRMFLRGRPVTMHVPDQQKGTYSLDQKVALPDHKLKLQWVYGYRGRDCRSNLYLLPTGEIVYFNASVVVLYNTEEQQQRHYLGHNDDVKCASWVCPGASSQWDMPGTPHPGGAQGASLSDARTTSTGSFRCGGAAALL